MTVYGCVELKIRILYQHLLDKDILLNMHAHFYLKYLYIKVFHGNFEFRALFLF